jgi:hypothetical protein
MKQEQKSLAVMQFFFSLLGSMSDFSFPTPLSSLLLK